MKRSEIRANRQKWIDFLKVPGRKKMDGVLDDGGGARCCLGHACYILNIKRHVNSDGYSYGEDPELFNAPEDLIELVGLWSDSGAVGDISEGSKLTDAGNFLYKTKMEIFEGIDPSSLVDMNDDYDARPWQIGNYLQSVIEGGRDTPFRPLSEYEE